MTTYCLLLLIGLVASYLFSSYVLGVNVLGNSISAGKFFASFLLVSGIVFMLFGCGGVFGGTARLAIKLRVEHDLNQHKDEVADLMIYVMSLAIGFLLVAVFVLLRS